MICITIGIGPIHESLARISARCLQEMTGLDVLILGERELKQSGLTNAAALKLKAFDFVNYDNILYFDADWFCIRNWNPTVLSNNSLISACNDFVLTIDFPKQYQGYDYHKFECYHLNNLAFHPISEIRDDYINEIKDFSKINLEFGKWINTGFWIANKKYHQQWLNKSLDYYNGSVGHHPEYYEQPAMNKAIEELEIGINYLSRKYNVLVTSRKDWPDKLVGLHIKIKHHQDFVDRIIRGLIKTPEQVKEYFANDKRK